MEREEGRGSDVICTGPAIMEGVGARVLTPLHCG